MSDKWKNALFWAVSLILVAGTVFFISSGMLPFAAVLCVEKIDCMKRCAAACEKVNDECIRLVRNEKPQSVTNSI